MSAEKRAWPLGTWQWFAWLLLGGLLLILLIYRSLGVFIGSLRADELHFLQNSWMTYSGQSGLEYIPPLYHYLLTYSWWSWGGDLSLIYGLRSLNFLMFCAQGFLVFRMMSLAFPALRSRYFSVLCSVLAAAYLALLAAFRGYEIRPEGLGNTLILLGICWVLRDGGSKLGWRHRLFLFICACLVIAASLSFRFTLPAFFLWCAVVAQVALDEELSAHQRGRVVAEAFLASACVAFLANYWFVDWGRILSDVGRYSLVTAPMSVYTRFTINAWSHYGAFVVLVLGAVGVLASWATLTAKLKTGRVVNALLLFAVISFYVFLFVWDINPRAYIHSIEWVLILGLFLYSVKALMVSRRASILAFAALAGAVSHLGYMGTRELSADRNSGYYLQGMLDSPSQEALMREDDVDLVKRFDIQASLSDQVNARREFCARHRGDFVIADSILHHPVCLVDMGTYDFAGWGNKPVDLLSLPADQSLIVLAADAAKLAPLAAHYGDRYKTSGNIAIIQKRSAPD